MRYVTMMFLFIIHCHMVILCVHLSTASQGLGLTGSNCKISRDLIYGGNLINCSNLGIKELPVNGLPDNITTLILSYNNITRLHNHSFNLPSLRFLRHLDIRASQIEEIEVDALFGLDNLEILDLEENNLPLCQTGKRSFPAGMFRHVPNLRHLFIGFNTKDHKLPAGTQTYPDNIDIFSSLPHLTNLSIDTINDTLYLGPEFSNLTHLTNLTVVCRDVSFINNNSLEGLWQLQVKVLSLVGFRTRYVAIEIDVFQNLSHLMYLTVYDSYTGNHNIMKALKPLSNRTMEAINLRRTNFIETYSIPNDVFKDGIIGYHLASYLRSICVANFAWTDSVLFAFKPNSVTTGAWPECIRTIDLSNNKLEHTGWLMVYMELLMLKHLREATMSSTAAPPSDQYPKLVHYILPEASRRDDGGPLKNNLDNKNITNIKRQTLSRSTDNLSRYSEALYSSRQTLSRSTDRISRAIHVSYRSSDSMYLRKDNINNSQDSQSSLSVWQSHDIEQPSFPFNGNFTLYLLASVRKVKLIDVIFAPFTISSFNLVWKNSNYFEELYWINNHCLRARGAIYGFEHLKVLDLTGSEFDIAEHFFDTFHGLEVFVLSGLKPDTFFKQISIQRLLRNLTSLRYLDVSNNKLNSLLFPPITFTSTPNVTHVILSQNRFSNIPFDLDTTPNIQVLDLSANAILFLTQEEMEALNNHAARVGHFLLRLQDNGIACVCSQVNLLVWTFTTHVTIDERGAAECVTDDGQTVIVNELSDIPTFYRACQGRIFLMTSLVMASSIGVVFLIAYLVTRFRSAIEAFLLRMFVRAFRPMRPEDYKIDVFIGYADGDHMFVRHVLRKYLEEILGLSTFIHQRDLQQGYTDLQFIEAIRNSWRVLLLLSGTFLNNYEMAHHVMKYASHSVTTVNLRRVFVLVEAAHVLDIPDYLHDVLDETQIIILPDLHHQLGYVQQQSIKQCVRAPQ